MVDYDFYINTYLGSAIDEKNFPAAAARAAAVLEGYQRHCRVQCPGSSATVWAGLRILPALAVFP